MRWGVALTSSDIILRKMMERRGGGGWKTSQWNLIKLRNKALLTCLFCLIFATCALLRLFNATHSRKTAKLTTRCVVEIRFKVKINSRCRRCRGLRMAKSCLLYIYTQKSNLTSMQEGAKASSREEKKREISRDEMRHHERRQNELCKWLFQSLVLLLLGSLSSFLSIYTYIEMLWLCEKPLHGGGGGPTTIKPPCVCKVACERHSHLNITTLSSHPHISQPPFT